MLKPKVAIVTIYSLNNFGNRLQNYAVHRVLSDMGFECQTLVCLKSFSWHMLRDIYHILGSVLLKKRFVRSRCFSHFTKRSTPVRFVYNRDFTIPSRIFEQYDYCVTGSDQVWNPEIRVHEKENYFLRFAPKSKRICFAPSFGVSSIDSQCLNDYKEWLRGFDHLSCRENEGVQLIRNLTGLDAQRLIDPTMMLDKDMWKEIYSPISVPQDPYILIYFIGKVSDNTQRVINEIAEKKSLIIIDIQSNEYYNLSPDGLLQLIDGASLVCTDSFHVAAFSINFNIPFYVFARVSDDAFGNHMLSRITSLLQLFGLEDRFEPDGCPSDLTCNFDEVNIKIKFEQKKVTDYLEESFSLSNK